MSVSSKNALLFADLCLKAKKYEIAEKIYTRAHDQDPFDLKPLFNLGILYASHLNMPRKALECYQKCLDLDSCNIDVLANISGLYLKVFEPTLSLEFSKKGLEIDSTNSICRFNWNCAMRCLGRLSEAVEQSWKWIRNDSPRPQIKDQCNDLIDTNSTSKIIVHCVKWGKKYDANYVNRLFRRIRALSQVIEKTKLLFLCHTEDPSDLDLSIKWIDFPFSSRSWSSWWMKAVIFQPTLIDEEFVYHDCIHIYLDLDTLIVGSFDIIIDIALNINGFITIDAGKFSCEGRSMGINSSLMIWKGVAFLEIFDYLVDHYNYITQVTYKFDHYLEMLFFDESEWKCHFLQDSWPEIIIDYSSLSPENCISHSLSNALFTEDCPFPLSSNGIKDVNSVDSVGDCDIGSNNNSCINHSCCSALASKEVFYQLFPSTVLVTFPLFPKPHQLQSTSWLLEYW